MMGTMAHDTPGQTRGAKWTPDRRLMVIVLGVFLADQLSKLFVTQVLGLELGAERQMIPGFFRLVHWGNTGAAWSMFHDNNHVLAFIGVIAFAALVWKRSYFEIHKVGGQWALGLLLGGIAGNVIDRFRVHHVIDFLLFYVQRRGVHPSDPSAEAIFPAFNVADSAICSGVGLLFLMSLRSDKAAAAAARS